MTTTRSNPTSTPRNQQGAVLFISLILLVVLSLIGIASMQVTTLQERMAGNYFTQNKAFEYAEWMVRFQENTIQATVNSGNSYVSQDENCKATYAGFGSTDAWANSKTATAIGGSTPGNMVPGSWYTRRIDKCISGHSPTSWPPRGSDNTNLSYQVVGVDNDAPPVALGGNAAASSMAVITTIYTP